MNDMKFPPAHAWHNTIREVLEACAEDGKPRPFPYLQELGSYQARLNYISRARRTGAFRHGLRVQPGAILEFTQPPLGTEGPGMLRLRKGTRITQDGLIAAEAAAMWQALGGTPVPWPNPGNQYTEERWNRRNAACDFRRADGMVTYEPQGGDNDGTE